MIQTIDDVQHWVAKRHPPQFILPARFKNASFESFQISADHPEHGDLVERVRSFAEDEPTPNRRFWRRSQEASGSGLFLVGPPGVGKTHLLASGFESASGPRLFATFDELVAAAGPLGMPDLIEIVCEPDLVCIDEVVLEDPGNITMLATLLQHMVSTGTNVLATANMPPQEAGGEGGWIRSFARELGAIASVFDICRIEGQDWRTARPNAEVAIADHVDSVLRVSWSDLQGYLLDTHPMHDAGWLSQVGQINVTSSIDPPVDKDRALRFIRFIDRVYDRNVRLIVIGSQPSPHDLVVPLVGDKRYVWHVRRGVSRLHALLGA